MVYLVKLGKKGTLNRNFKTKEKASRVAKRYSADAKVVKRPNFMAQKYYVYRSGKRYKKTAKFE